jgi:antitoxin component YwqK of YwqJK toxin-antitoxin module
VLAIKIKGGYYFKEYDEYYVVPDTTRSLSLSFKIKKANGKTFWTKPLDVHTRRLPPPESFFGTKGNNEKISIGELRTIRRVNIGFGDGFAPAYVHYKVQQFDIAIIGPGILYFHQMDDLFPDKIFADLKGGEFIYINNIQTILIETKFPIKAAPALVQVKSEYPYRNYILTGFIKNRGKDSLFKINTASLNEAEIKKICRGHKDSTWKLYPLGCDSNVLISEFKYKDDTLKSMKQYDYSGNLIIKENLDQKVTHSEYNKGQLVLSYQYVPEPAYDLLIADTLPRKESWRDYQPLSVYGKAKQCLFGEWKSFYPNGFLKEQGNFDTTYKTIRDTSVYSDPNDPYKITGVSEYHEVISAKNGIWHYYSPDGKLIKTVNYQMGIPKKE